MNENRSLLLRLYEYKKKDNPAISREETMQIAITRQTTDKREHSEAMKKLLEDIKTVQGDNTGTRLMILVVKMMIYHLLIW